MCERMKDALERIRAIATGEEAVVGEEQDFEGEQVALAEIGKIAATALATPAQAATQPTDPPTIPVVRCKSCGGEGGFYSDGGFYNNKPCWCLCGGCEGTGVAKPQPTPARAVRWWTAYGCTWMWDGKEMWHTGCHGPEWRVVRAKPDAMTTEYEIHDPATISKLEAEFAARGEK